MDFMNSDEAHRAKAEVLEEELNEQAERLSVASVQVEAMKWAAMGAGVALNEAIAAFVALINRRTGKRGVTLFEHLCQATTPDIRRIVEAEWLKLRPFRRPKYVFDDEDDLVEAMNEEVAYIRNGASVGYVLWDAEGHPHVGSRSAAKDTLEKYRLQRVVTTTDSNGNKNRQSKSYSGFQIWLRSQDRKEFAGEMFHPDLSKTPPNYLNRWTGFAVKPRKGDWSLMQSHLLDNICQGNRANYEFLLDRISQMFSEPGRKSGVIVVVRGAHGTGKTKLAEWLGSMVGRHAMVIEKSKHLTGDFNGHLETMIFVRAEEAVFAGDPLAAKALKVLGTESDFTYERKGVDARSGLNFTRVYMATNEDWAVPVEVGDRRYFVLDCGDAQKENKTYFAAIDAQMENGGAEAMMFDMLERGMTFAKLGKVPMTEAKRDQLQSSMTPQMQWLAEALADGQFPAAYAGAPQIEWPEQGGAVAKAEILASFQGSAPGHRAPRSGAELGKFLKKSSLGITAQRGNANHSRIQQYKLPPLETARAVFLRTCPGFSFADVPKAPSVVGDADNVSEFAAGFERRRGKF